MLRSQFEHVLRAAGAVTNENVLIIVGSQAILGSLEEPPAELTVSREVDLYPRDAPEKADLISGSLGQQSLFDETFGYHADGVGPETTVVAPSWASRLVPFQSQNTGGVLALCLSPVDIAIGKLAAGREKDLAYVKVMLTHGIVSPEAVLALIPELNEPFRSLVESRLRRLREEA